MIHTMRFSVVSILRQWSIWKIVFIFCTYQRILMNASLAPTPSPSSIRSNVNIINTIAGTGSQGNTGTGGVATAMTLNYPRSVWKSSTGVIYIVETVGNCVRSFTYPNGIVSNTVGVCGYGVVYSGDNIPATSALFTNPIGIGVNTIGAIYVATYDSNRVRMVTNAGIISTYMGLNGASSSTGDGGAASAATIKGPHGLWVDSLGQVYVSGHADCTVRKINTALIVSRVAGVVSTGSFAGDNGQATSAFLNNPERVFVDSTGVTYISDTASYRVRLVSISGIISTAVGTGVIAYNGENIPGTSCNFYVTTGVVVDSSNGDTYVSNRDYGRIQVLTRATGLVSTFAGSGTTTAFGGDNGAATSATINPDGSYLGSDGLFLLSDSANSRIRVIYSVTPTIVPTIVPTVIPTIVPSVLPSVIPTIIPTVFPSVSPSVSPTFVPSAVQSMNIYIIAGNGVASSTGTGGLATAASLNYPRDIWEDSMGVLYFVEWSGNCVRKFQYPNGLVSNSAGVCGSTYSYGGDNGQATSAIFNYPVAVGVNTVGVLYICDHLSNRIRMVTTTGIMSTAIGLNGASSDTGDGGLCTAATLYKPHGIWLDSTGQVFIAAYINGYVRKISTSMIVTKVAGSGASTSFSGDGGQATSAILYCPERVFIDSMGIVYVSDTANYRVRQVSTTGIISTVMGTGSATYNGENLAGTSSAVTPSGLVVDTSNGNIYVSSRDNSRLQVLTKPTNLVTTFAGWGSTAYSGDGAATSAGLKPDGLFLSTSNQLFLADLASYRIRVIYSVSPTVIPTFSPTLSPSTILPTCCPSICPSTNPTTIPTSSAPSSIRSSLNNIYTLAGSNTAGTSGGTGGVATAMTLNNPRSVWQDTTGMIYVAETNGNCLRKFSYPNGIVMNSIGVCGTASYGGDNSPATSALLSFIVGFAVNTVGSLYVVDYNNNRVRTVAASDIISTFVGLNGAATDTGDGGAASASTIYSPHGLWCDSVGQVFIVTVLSSLVRKVSSSLIISKIAGISTGACAGDGGQATSAYLKNPERVFVDTSGILYVSDTVNYRVRKIVQSGIITTIVGTGVATYNGENVPGTSANLNYVRVTVIDTSNGDLYMANRDAGLIQVLSGNTNLVTKFAGTGSTTYSGEGGAATSAGMFPDGLFLSTDSKLFVGDCDNNRVRVIYSVTPTAQPTSPSVAPTMLPTTLVPSTLPSYIRSNVNNVYTIAGTGVVGYAGTGGVSTAMTLNYPRTVWLDSTGIMYVTESSSNCIRKFPYPNGIVSISVGVCGSSGSYAGDNGAASSAGLNTIISVGLSSLGIIYLTDNSNNRVRTVSSSFIITTFIGNGDPTDLGNGGTASAATIYGPHGLWVDSLGQVYVTSNGHNSVRKINTVTIVSLITGTGTTTNGFSGDGGPATSALIYSPERVFVDSSGIVYFGDCYNSRVRQISVSGIISTVIGTSLTAYNNENVKATASNLNFPTAVVVDTLNGDIYVASRSNARVMVMTKSSGLVSTFAGSGSSTFSGDNGAATSAGFNQADGLFLTTDSKLFIVEYASHRVRVVYSVAPSVQPTAVPTLVTSSSPTVSYSPSSIPTKIRSTLNNIYTVAGTGTATSTGTGGVATAMTLNNPRQVLQDMSGVVYVAEYQGNCIRRFTYPNGIVNNFGGVCASGSYSGDSGSATSAQLLQPTGMGFNSVSAMYISDEGNSRVRMIAVSGIITTVMGNGVLTNTGDGGAASAATIAGPCGLWLDSLGQVYIAIFQSHIVRLINSMNIASTIAGNGVRSFTGDGGQATSATLNNPIGVFVDSTGLLYVGDGYNFRVRTVTLSGTISTILGSGVQVYNSENLPATSFNLNTPSGIVIDTSNGDLYVSSKEAHRVVALTKTSNIVNTYAGGGSSDVDSVPATSASLYGPFGLFLTTSGLLFVGDTLHNRIRIVYSVTPTSCPSLYPSLIPTNRPSSIRSSLNVIYTLAGNEDTSNSGTGGTASAMSLNLPRAVWEDSAGVLYITEYLSNCVRKFSYPNGIVSIAIGVCGNVAYTTNNGPATSTVIGGPVGLFGTTTGLTYFSDYATNLVRQVSTTSIISTVMGTGSTTNSGDGGAASSASIATPHGIWTDSIGQVYVSTLLYIRKISTTSVASVVVGIGSSGSSGDGGQATNAAVQNVERVFIDTSGTILFADTNNNRVRQITTLGIVSTLLGTGQSSYNGENVQGTAIGLNTPTGVVADTSNGDVYVSSRSNMRVHVLTKTTNLVTTYAGNGVNAFTGDGGAPTSASQINPDPLFLDTSGRLFIVNYNSGAGNRLRVVYSTSLTTQPTMTPSIGPSEVPTMKPSVTSSCCPSVCPSVSPSLTPSVCPTLIPSNSPSNFPTVIPSLSPSLSPSLIPTTAPRSNWNNVYTIAGTGVQSSTGTGGSSLSMTLNTPRTVWEDSLGVVYVAENNGCCIRKFPYPSGIVSVSVGMCGVCSFGGDGGQASAATLKSAIGTSIDTVGVMYVCDYSDNRVRTISSNSMISTLIGTGVGTNSGDGGFASAATINGPHGLWLDTLGQVYIGTYTNSIVRKINSVTIVTLIAGTGLNSFSGDGGPATSASLNNPCRVFVDSTGLVYIGDTSNHRFRQVTLSGIISTVIGTGSTGYNGENIRATSCNINIATGVVADTSSGDIYGVSLVNNRIQMMTKTSGLVTTYAGSGSASSGNDDGSPATSAQFNNPDGIYLDMSNRLLVADQTNYRIKVVFSVEPSQQPTLQPSLSPTLSIQPTLIPSTSPSLFPTLLPSITPSMSPSQLPSKLPTYSPTVSPSLVPSIAPSTLPSCQPSVMPTVNPSTQPTIYPSLIPSVSPSTNPTVSPSLKPTAMPSISPSSAPSIGPSVNPTIIPSVSPSLNPTSLPTVSPTNLPSVNPSIGPSLIPSMVPSDVPSVVPSVLPSLYPSIGPSFIPTLIPSTVPTISPSLLPSLNPSHMPSLSPTNIPSVEPTELPSDMPTVLPTEIPSILPSTTPSVIPTLVPSISPSESPSLSPTLLPSVAPTVVPSCSPSLVPTMTPSVSPTLAPTVIPSAGPSIMPSTVPSLVPTLGPTAMPSISPSQCPSEQPTLYPSIAPSLLPSIQPTVFPSIKPSILPTYVPSISPTMIPTTDPSVLPSHCPSVVPSLQPSTVPSNYPTIWTLSPTSPTIKPTRSPSIIPSIRPSRTPSVAPSVSVQPSFTVTMSVPPSEAPSCSPTQMPSTTVPSKIPSIKPSMCPTTLNPTATPTTIEYYATHPKATLPLNDSISVLGLYESFKIVLPFFAVSSGASGIVYSNVTLGSGTMGTAYVLKGNVGLSSILSVDNDKFSSYSNFIALDLAKRSVSVVSDFNGDSHDDLIIGDPYAAKCYVLFGTSQGLQNMNKGFTIFGESEGDLTGWSVSGAGDMNNDTMQDIIVGAPFAKGVGAVYVIYGKRTMVDVYLNNLTSSQGFALYGAVRSDYLGISVSGAGDVNKDGCDDIIMGAVGTVSFNAGAAYILYGGRHLFSFSSIGQMTFSQGYKLTGAAYMYAGFSVSKAGDVNKDGFDDVLIGSSPVKSGLSLTAYLIYGSASVSSNVVLTSLTDSQGVVIVGGGTIVSSAGNIYADKFSDVLISSDMGYSDLAGFIVYNNFSSSVPLSRRPSALPTLSSTVRSSVPPSIRPSAQPFDYPTRKPSTLPSFVPTAPTELPVIGLAIPSVEPSESPTIVTTIPTEAPTESPTMSPSNEPSEAPSLNPSVIPSLHPSLLPSIVPTIVPSPAQPSRAPISRPPQAFPTLLPTAPVVPLPNMVIISNQVSSGGVVMYNDSATIGSSRYVVNATGHIEINPSRGGFCEYMIVPQLNTSTLSIETFNTSTDSIDLTLFSNIVTLSDLNITLGGTAFVIKAAVMNTASISVVTIRVSSLQQIKIKHIQGEFTAKNIILYAALVPVEDGTDSVAVKSLSFIIPVSLVVLIALCYFVAHHSKGKKVSAEYTKERFIGQFETTLDGEYLDLDGFETPQSYASEISIEMSTESLAEDIPHSVNEEEIGEDVEDVHSADLLSEHTIDSDGEFVYRDEIEKDNNYYLNDHNLYDASLHDSDVYHQHPQQQVNSGLFYNDEYDTYNAHNDDQLHYMMSNNPTVNNHHHYYQQNLEDHYHHHEVENRYFENEENHHHNWQNFNAPLMDYDEEHANV